MGGISGSFIFAESSFQMKCEPAATAMIVEAERFGTHKRKLLYLDMLLTQQSDTST